jgi:hypothetical protein
MPTDIQRADWIEAMIKDHKLAKHTVNALMMCPSLKSHCPRCREIHDHRHRNFSPFRRFVTWTTREGTPPAVIVDSRRATTSHRGHQTSPEVGGRGTLLHTGRGQEGLPHGNIRRRVCRILGEHDAGRRTARAEEGAGSGQPANKVLSHRQRRRALETTDRLIRPGGQAA